VLFLSDEWFDAMAAAVAGVEVPDGVTLRVGQVVTATPTGDVSYLLDCRDGRCTIVRDTVERADVVFRSDLAVAQQLAAGGPDVAPGHAVLRGDVQVSGDVTRLLATGDLAARLAATVGTLRSTESPESPG
jgi:spore germination protein GerM